MSPNVAPILVVVHMPAAYTGAFASRLNSLCDIFVCEAEENLALRNGMAVIAAGDRHLELVASKDGYRVHMGGYDPVNG
ncbi:MAG: chemotaxis protein CheB, partial [Paracoccaceae bacterium]